MNFHAVGIICKECNKKWRITIPLTGNTIEAFATLCECGNIIVGNYNTKFPDSEGPQTRVTSIGISLDEKYLSNGGFDFFELSGDDSLPELPLE